MLIPDACRQRTTDEPINRTNSVTLEKARIRVIGRALVAAVCGVLLCACQPSVLTPTPTHGSLTTGTGATPGGNGPAGQGGGSGGDGHRSGPENGGNGHDSGTPIPTNDSNTPFSLSLTPPPSPMDAPQLTLVPELPETDQPAGHPAINR
jgi:hypothetical protein